MNKITCNPLVPVMDTHKDAIRIAAGFADLKSHQLEVILAFITFCSPSNGIWKKFMLRVPPDCI